MERKFDIFKDYGFGDKPFENPLQQNILSKYYLDHNMQSYDYTRLCNNPYYSKALYDNYINHLIEYHRPNYPPDINVEEYVNENESNKKIKDLGKMNKRNSFMVYQKYLNKHLQRLGINFPMMQLSQLASILYLNM